MEEFEIWMPIKGYEGKYEVSHFGRVRGLSVYAKREVSKLWDNGMWLSVTFWNNGKHETKYVHQLVLKTFNCERPGKLECCHNDGNYKNNYIGNLRWGTTQENANDKERHGTVVKGEKNGMSKLFPEDIFKIRKLFNDGIHNRDIAKIFNISHKHVYDIGIKRRWKHL